MAERRGMADERRSAGERDGRVARQWRGAAQAARDSHAEGVFIRPGGPTGELALTLLWPFDSVRACSEIRPQRRPRSENDGNKLYLRDCRGYWTRVVLGVDTRPLATLCRAAVFPFSIVYGVGVSIRNGAYSMRILRSEKLPGPVVSVGNISVGGTGKTPMVEWIAKQLIELGKQPAILSRGYGAKTQHGGELVNEERAVLAENVGQAPHRCDPDRVRAGRLAAQEGADCFVLDDGFQHRRARRDLDIVLMDATAPLGMLLLPAGSLREPLRSLRRGDVIVLTHVDLCSEIKRQGFRRLILKTAPGVTLVEAAHRPTAVRVLPADTEESPDALRGRKVFAFCGIGNPESFARTLEKLGAEIVGAVYFEDHHAYTKADCSRMMEEAGKLDAATCVTTQKDAVKAAPLWEGGRLSVLKVRMEIVNGQEALIQKLRSAMRG